VFARAAVLGPGGRHCFPLGGLGRFCRGFLRRFKKVCWREFYAIAAGFALDLATGCAYDACFAVGCLHASAFGSG